MRHIIYELDIEEECYKFCIIVNVYYVKSFQGMVKNLTWGRKGVLFIVKSTLKKIIGLIFSLLSTFFFFFYIFITQVNLKIVYINNLLPKMTIVYITNFLAKMTIVYVTILLAKTTIVYINNLLAKITIVHITNKIIHIKPCNWIFIRI